MASRFPAFAQACVHGKQLRAGYTANLGGQQFVTDPATPLKQGETLLLMNLDAGG